VDGGVELGRIVAHGRGYTSSPTERISSRALDFWTTPGRIR
jgi:hypothetical protein